MCHNHLLFPVRGVSHVGPGLLEEVLRGFGKNKKKGNNSNSQTWGCPHLSPPRVPNSRRGFQTPGRLCGQGGVGRMDTVDARWVPPEEEDSVLSIDMLGGGQVLHDVVGTERLWGVR